MAYDVDEAEYSVWGWESFFSELESFLRRANREIGSASYQYAEFVLERLSTCVHTLSNICEGISLDLEESEDLSELCRSLEDVKSTCNSLLAIWQSYMDCLDSTMISLAPSDGFIVPMSRRGRGRPQLAISQDQLEYLRSLNFSWSSIARLLGVSRMTVYRRRQYFNMLDVEEARTDMSDEDLHQFIRQLRVEMPNIGQSLVIGRLRSVGYFVHRERVRDAIRTTDPLNTPLRWRGVLATRRPYSVPAPNSLWHVGMCGVVLFIFVRDSP